MGSAGGPVGAIVTFTLCIILTDYFEKLGEYVVEILIEDDEYIEQD